MVEPTKYVNMFKLLSGPLAENFKVCTIIDHSTISDCECWES